MTDPWSWPKEPVVIKRFVVEEFQEGAFLSMALDKMSHLMDQVRGFFSIFLWTDLSVYLIVSSCNFVFVIDSTHFLFELYLH
jgi:hypothetical protein